MASADLVQTAAQADALVTEAAAVSPSTANSTARGAYPRGPFSP
jgi:hypothetical protein